MFSDDIVGNRWICLGDEKHYCVQLKIVCLLLRTDFFSTDLDGWSVRSLSELYDELDSTVREYSEVLIQQLALREELDYEKELMNQFISLHLNIQKKKRELQADQKKGTTPSDGTIAISVHFSVSLMTVNLAL